MELKSVADLMIPIDEYPTVSLDASLLDAIRVVKEAQETRPRTRAFYRAAGFRYLSSEMTDNPGMPESLWLNKPLSPPVGN